MMNEHDTYPPILESNQARWVAAASAGLEAMAESLGGGDATTADDNDLVKSVLVAMHLTMAAVRVAGGNMEAFREPLAVLYGLDRKSTRLNSSHER